MSKEQKNSKREKQVDGRIYDCFTFNDEIELLEFRLKVYLDIVDIFVIAESKYSFNGKPKKLYATDFIRNAASISSKVRIVEYTPIAEMIDSAESDRWPLENLARQSLVAGFSDAQANDLIIVSDADEFPSHEQIINARQQTKIVGAKTPMFFRAPNLLVEHSKNWNRVRMGPPELMKDLNTTRSSHFTSVQGQAGMHLSYLEFSTNGALDKHATFAHSEIDVGRKFLKSALEVAKIFQIDHLGRVRARQFGLLSLMQPSQLNEFQRTFYYLKPELYNFQICNKNFLRRVSASWRLTNAWKNQNHAELEEIIQLGIFDVLLDFILASMSRAKHIPDYLMRRSKNLGLKIFHIGKSI
jgi:hypothetical protein